MIIEKPFDIGKARERTQHYADQSERDLWTCNEKLKHEIERCSFSGMNSAVIDITLCTDWASTSIASELFEMYLGAGYNTKIDRLRDGCNKFSGYRLTVSW